MPIARLIAEFPRLSASLDRLQALLAGQGITALTVREPVQPDDVLELSCTQGDAAVLRAAVDTAFGPADVLVADRTIEVPHVFVSDMDSTMIAAECIDELADFAGLKDQIAAITERAMQGELDFAAALRERVGLLAGLNEAAITQCLEERIAPMPGARTLVETLKSTGCQTILVTGGFHQFADPVAAQLGFEKVVANRLELLDGELSGALTGGIVDSTVKREVLQQAVSGRAGAISLATGDGANDIPMLQAATYGIAYYAKPKARAAAHGWVDTGDLTSILRLLGVPREQWLWD